MQILIIEDEENETERFENLLKEVISEKINVEKCNSARKCIQWLNENNYPDLVVFNIQLSDGPGFELLSQMSKKVPMIFTIIQDSPIITNIKARGLHYLTKPFKKEELKNTIGHCLASYNNINRTSTDDSSETINPGKKFQERFIINTGSQINLLYDFEIAYIFTESKIVYITTFNKQKFIADYSLEKFEKMLDPTLFFRINRQFIVSLKSIKKMKPASKQRIELILEPYSPIETITSFERRAQFKKWLLGGTSLLV